MLIVSDTSPICYLILIEQIDLLPQLYRKRKGRSVARSRGLAITGLLGILDSAAANGLLDFPSAIAKLQTTNFRVSPQLIRSLLQQYQRDR